MSINELSQSSLTLAISRGRLPHATLISADEIVCNEMVDVACCLLQGIKRERLVFCTDYVVFDGSAINVEAIEGLCSELIRPPLSPCRVIYIRRAGQMSEAVQNKLLKTLEEPPEGNFFFLNGNEQGLLPTILSRCAHLNVGQADIITAAELAEQELRNQGLETAEISLPFYAYMLSCRIHDVIKAATDDRFRELIVSGIDYVASIGQATVFSPCLEKLKSADNTEALLMLGIMSRCLIDMQAYLLTGELGNYQYLYSATHYAQLTECARRLCTKTEPIIKILDRINETSRLLAMFPLTRSEKGALDRLAVMIEQVVK